MVAEGPSIRRKSMKMEPREIGVVAEAAAFLVAAVLAVTPVVAQPVPGELGSPNFRLRLRNLAE
jgi:hypothetical protein